MHEYPNKQIQKQKKQHSLLSNQQLLKNSLKIQTKIIENQYDYNLPLKQLQYTKTRKYKQNLYPLFTEIQTTNNRYDFTKGDSHFIKSKHYSKFQQNISKKSDKFIEYDICANQKYLVPNQNQSKQSKINKYKQRSRILSQNVNTKQKPSIFSLGQMDCRFKKLQVQNFLHDESKTLDLKQLFQKQIPLNGISFQKKNSHSRRVNKALKQNPHQQKNNFAQIKQQLNRFQLAQEWLEQINASVQKINIQIKQDEQKLRMLKREVEMHKEKNVLKEKQIYLVQIEKDRHEKKQKQLKHQLQNHSNKLSQLQEKSHKNSKILRSKKEQLKKQSNWLKQQNVEIKTIEEKFEKLKQMIRGLEEQEQKRQYFWQQLQKEEQKNEQFNSYLQQLDNKIKSLKSENQLIQQDTSLHEMHLEQISNLESKFKKQTQAYDETLSRIYDDIQKKKQFISQHQEIGNIIKELQLENGRMSEQKIILDQQIQQINMKIGVKKRNIRYIQRNQDIKKLEPYKSKQQPRKTTNNRKKQDSKVFVRSRPKSQTQNIPLPTIRQQSKNTSAYQSPKIQNQDFNQSSDRQLQLDSQQISRTEIYKPHVQNSDNKLKKYLIVESEEEGMSNMHSSYCFKQRNSDQIFLQNQKKPSIEVRLLNEQEMRTKQQSRDKKYYRSMQLSPTKKVESKFIAAKQQQMRSPIKTRQPNIGARKSHEQRVILNYEKSKESSKSNNFENRCVNEYKNEFEQEPLQSFQIESLISQFQKIKSSSCFNEEWKQKI